LPGGQCPADHLTWHWRWPLAVTAGANLLGRWVADHPAVSRREPGPLGVTDPARVEHTLLEPVPSSRCFQEPRHEIPKRAEARSPMG
jgi:hypothetical protein